MEQKTSGPFVGHYDAPFSGFEKLMPHRIREVLLVAAPYDSFLLADDDRLTELVFSEHPDLNFRYTPRVTRVSTAEEALKLIANKKFDLVITMAQVGDLHTAAFAGETKKISPNLPVILLCSNTPDLTHLPEEDRSAFDKIFLWLGDPRILMAIINLVEDRLNMDHDIALSNVQTLILIEDSVQFYSSYLPIIYAELMKQTQLLMAEGINLSHKMLRMRARPKILLASSFEEAWELYTRHHSNLLGVITDVQFPHEGKLDPQAGFLFTERIKTDNPDIPVLIQSSDAKFETGAQSMGASFLDKRSPNLLKQLQEFILENFGFGDFVFRLPNGFEVGRATDLHSMTQMLKIIPDESIEYHANHNHFSKWLMARTEFEIAYRIRPRKISEFQNINGLRNYLIETLHQFIHKTRSGAVIQFDGRFFDSESQFVKIGKGSIGGKARGLAFINFLLSKNDFSNRFQNARIVIPHTTVIGTDVFDFFMEQNHLYSYAQKEHANGELYDAFAKAKLPEYVLSDLRTLIDKIRDPLAVRSSSLLEDSRSQPFAGIYKTYMLPNNHPDPSVRLEQLSRAIQYVYASTFSAEAKSYLKFTSYLPEEEKMAVIIQRLVGQPYGNGARSYPACSGVVQSYNYYPVPPLKPEDGVAYVALGLGTTVMNGYRSLRFSPNHPHTLHQFSTIGDYFSNSQNMFMAVDTTQSTAPLSHDSESNILKLGLDAAEADGTLALMGSTYSPDDDQVYDGIARPGTRLVTFAPILKDDLFPLADILKFLSGIGMDAMGSHVEMEFAVQFHPKRQGPVEFHVLQMRPMISRQTNQTVHWKGTHSSRVICASPQALGNGYISDITDILYIQLRHFHPAETPRIAMQIGRINEALKRENKSCLLIGPGRWGSADHWLGIPVKWNQICASKVIVETALEDFMVTPSFGTHFFHNMTSLGIGYFTVNQLKNEGSIDWEWLDRQQPIYESAPLRHIRLSKPLDIRIDGSIGQGVILKPAPEA